MWFYILDSSDRFIADPREVQPSEPEDAALLAYAWAESAGRTLYDPDTDPYPSDSREIYAVVGFSPDPDDIKVFDAVTLRIGD